MKFTADRKALAANLSLALRTCETRTTIPILSHFLVVANGNVSLTATDLEISCTCQVEANIHTQGQAAIPARAFSEYINALDSETVEVSISDKGIASLVGGKNKARINCSSDAYPEIPKMEGTTASIKASTFESMLRRIVFVPEQTVSGALEYRNCAFIEFRKGSVLCYAADGRRGSLCVEACDYAGPVRPLPLSVKCIQEIIAVCALNPDGDCSLMWDENLVFALVGDVCLTMRTLSVRPPAKMEQMINSEMKFSAKASARALKSALQRSNIFADQKSRKTVLSISENAIDVASSSFGGSSNQGVDTVADGSISTGINSTFLIEVLSVIGDEQILIEYTDQATSLLRISQPEGPHDFKYVVAPMMI